MRSTFIRITSALVAIGFVAVTFLAPAGATGTWKSLRSPNGHRIHWHSCTVTYSVDMNGYSRSKRKALNTAIRNTERASGVDFVLVPWRKADLKISMSHRRRGNILAVTQPYLFGDEYTDARINIYPKAFTYDYRGQVDNYEHEFGHVLGLDHVRGSDIMNAYVVPFPTHGGWRTGLRWLYQDCR